MTHPPAPVGDPQPARTVTSPAPTGLPPVEVRADASETGHGLESTALPLLTADEEAVLGFWIEAGVLAASVLNASPSPSANCRAQLEEVRVLGERSMERMTRSNVRLVYWCISRYWTGRDTAGLGTEDLAAAGIEGLIHAIWMWDYQRGLKFSTYGVAWIRQHIERAVSRARPVWPTRVELHRLEELFQTRVLLESRLGRAATGRELAAELRTTVAALRDLLLLERNVGHVVSLDQPLARDGASTFGDLLAANGPTPEQLVESRLLRDELEIALEHLPARERAVVTARVGWSCPSLTEADVAGRYGVSVEQVRATTTAALQRLRTVLVEQGRQDAA